MGKALSGDGAENSGFLWENCLEGGCYCALGAGKVLYVGLGGGCMGVYRRKD